MKSTRYILLGVGSAGLLAALFGLIKGGAFMDHLMTIVCGLSLIYGYFTIHKTEKTE